MAQITPSRNLSEPPADAAIPRALSGVIDRVMQHPSLTPKKKGEIVSAIRRFSRAFDKDPAQIPAQPQVIGRQRRMIVPAEIGMTPASWSNTVSLVRKGLEVTGCYVRPEKYYPPMSATWAEPAGNIANKKLMYALNRFFHFADEQGWHPRDITDAHIDRYRDYLETKTITPDPAELCRLTCQNWNRACRETPDWPGKPVTVPARPRVRASFWVKWSDVPETLHAQLQKFLASRAEFDVLKEGAAKPCSPRTIKDDEENLRAFISALDQRGRKASTLPDLPALLEPNTLRDGLRFFLDRKEGKTSAYTFSIANTLVALARHLRAQTPPFIDEARLEDVEALRKKLAYKQKGVTTKNKALLRLFTDPRNVAKLLFLPSRLLEGVSLKGRPTVYDALRVRWALAIEILLVFPIREKNLVTLHLKNNIVRTGTHKNAKVLIVIPADDVKNGFELEVDLPQETIDLLDLYLERYRPLLVRDGGDWLFPGETGGHMHPRGFGEQLKRVIHRETGLPVNVHFFRHFSAKLWLDHNPGQFEVMQYALGHKSTKTLLKFYAEFSSIKALALYDGHLLKLREELAHLATPARCKSRRRR